MAETTSAVAETAPLPDPAAIERAERFTLERSVHAGETAADALAPGTGRRRALDAALREIEQGRKVPSAKWRRRYSLLLGLERVLSEDEPRLLDGTTLNPHQVDALSGTLTALLAAAQNGGGSHEPDDHVPEPVLAVDDEPEVLDEDVDEDVAEGAAEDPNAHKRFWFEHATGAGKTVAAMGFVEASRTGGILILTHRRNLVD